MRLGPILAATALATLVAACGQSQEKSAGGPAGAPVSDAEKQTLLASYPAPYNTADLANGQTKFGLCQSCHTITPGGANMTGPNLHGVFGRQVGALPGYNYSDAVRQADFVWDGEQLDHWLENPRTFLRGTKMSFVGIADAQDRRDVIAFLKVETGYAPQP